MIDPNVLKPNPLASANSRRLFRFRRLEQIRCPLASTGLAFPAAVAERERSLDSV